MIEKIISNSWNFGYCETSMVKQAKWYVEYKHEPGSTIVSAIFLGAGEYYGSNRNGDWFDEEELIKCHPSFLKGHHYKHHKNDDPENSYGDILSSFYNPDMHRVEGIIKILDDKSADMIEKINKGIPIPLSMACRVKYDVCSVCGHKSYTTKEYCDHLKQQMCEILPDGRLVCALNPNPEFFDISEVSKGADPTAFTIRKIASAEHANTNLVSTNDVYNMSKSSLLTRLADIEKKIVGLIRKGDPTLKTISSYVDNKQLNLDENDIKINKKGNLYKLADFGINCKIPIYGYYESKNSYLTLPTDIVYNSTGHSILNKEATYNNKFNYARIIQDTSNIPDRYSGLICKIAETNSKTLEYTYDCMVDDMTLYIAALHNLI